MNKPLVPTDLLKSLDKVAKPDDASSAKPAPKAKPAPETRTKLNTKAQGKGTSMHTRSSNRGK